MYVRYHYFYVIILKNYNVCVRVCVRVSRSQKEKCPFWIKVKHGKTSYELTAHYGLGCDGRPGCKAISKPKLKTV